MDVLQAIEHRRAVKAFDPQHRMEQRAIEDLLAMAQLSPTAFNIQHCRFVVVTDPALRRDIRKVSSDQAQVTDASLLLILCADLQAWRKDPGRYWSQVAEPLRESLISMITGYYEGREEVQRDECMRSCGIAAQTVMLAAQGLGYDSCPMDGFDFDAVAKLINLPADHVISMFVAVGKALEPAHPRGGKLPADAVVILDRF